VGVLHSLGQPDDDPVDDPVEDEEPLDAPPFGVLVEVDGAASLPEDPPEVPSPAGLAAVVEAADVLPPPARLSVR
jgi:hypothetical protein